jgi:glycosyltransferase involved in cell wall biosynthesis
MKILFIAPLPPPITGHSIAAQVLLEHLQRNHSVEVVNLSEGSKHDGTITLKRVLLVLKVIWDVMRAARRSDRLYLTISESIAGNIKDIFLYAAIGKLIRRSVIHLHGGSFGKQVVERTYFLRKLNQFYISKLAAVVVSGPSHLSIFDNLISSKKIYTIPNFAQDFMFVDPKQIELKFSESDAIVRVLYVSGMTSGKGYLRLLEAYETLCEFAKSRIRIDFAGKFDSELEKREFIERISRQSGIVYHGVISNQMKANLFAGAHIFCLPTSFQEGQPISIIEAYASGCVVLTTPRPGILDIFDPSINGFVISSDNSILLKEMLEIKCLDLSSLRIIANKNRCLAETKFREKTFCESVETVMSAVNP